MCHFGGDRADHAAERGQVFRGRPQRPLRVRRRVGVATGARGARGALRRPARGSPAAARLVPRRARSDVRHGHVGRRGHCAAGDGGRVRRAVPAVAAAEVGGARGDGCRFCDQSALPEPAGRRAARVCGAAARGLHGPAHAHERLPRLGVLRREDAAEQHSPHLDCQIGAAGAGDGAQARRLRGDEHPSGERVPCDNHAVLR
mmetsp:Transcript_19233/g.50485  ORF Transcript_19233/g.50485 Transcript_19233/m.50485 type:complete len:202 (+) Transcript_19233:416-1021(+)